MKDAFWVAPLAGFVGLGTFFANGGPDGFAAPDWSAVVLAVAACLALMLRRSAPALAILLVGLLVGGYFKLGHADGPIYLALLIGCGVVALATPAARWLPWSVAAVSVSLAGLWVRALGDETGWAEPLGRSIVLIALTATAASLGSLARSRAQTRREREARVSTEEQLRMAQDLHDGVGHGLAVIAMQAGVALHVLDRDPASVRTALEAIRDTSRESLEALRAELSRLSGTAPLTVRHGLADLDALAGRVRAAELAVSLHVTDQPLPEPIAQTAYLVVQEALTNVLRHARARSVEIDVAVGADGRLVTVRVADDGIGADTYDEDMGLFGMRSRVATLGGSLVVRSRPGEGFALVAEMPL
ncbi:sensor histidine kinase [Nocardioides sp. zg-ZUI104]|uniref:sensor histidine kinase n=1 Tax=Nocardioides faecalis TaxID=2803858 RepID=UPI001BCAF371|nr:sensor histidine kinase [Nocardioides faecalis]MBS4754617.1 sensor histidine kinase [Nocardioides faecalis]